MKNPISFPFPISNNAHLKIGEKVICTRSVVFNDGKWHLRGETYTVEPDTQAYFSLFTGVDDSCNYLRIGNSR